MFRTALDLKRAVDAIPHRVAPIGEAPAVVREWVIETAGEDGSDDQDDDVDTIASYIRAGARIAAEDIYSFDARYRLGGKTCLKVRDADGETVYDGGLFPDASALEAMMRAADPSPYGDMRKMETVIDLEVRKASEISADRFEISQDAVEQLERDWLQSGVLCPGSVRLVPYKINFYGKGGKFKAHRDTPEKGLVGTALVSLTGDFEGGELTVETRQGVEIWKKGYAGAACFFYPDAVHEVREVTRGVRATIAFKVFARNDERVDHNEAVTDGIAHFLEKAAEVYRRTTEKRTLGLILAHEYDITATALKGVDQNYQLAARKLGWVVDSIPVLVRLCGTFGNSGGGERVDEATGTCCVYPLLDEHIEFARGMRERPETPYDDLDIHFYSLGESPGLEWKSDWRPYDPGWSGNYADGKEDSVYLSRALIIEIGSGGADDPGVKSAGKS